MQYQQALQFVVNESNSIGVAMDYRKLNIMWIFCIIFSLGQWMEENFASFIRIFDFRKKIHIKCHEISIKMSVFSSFQIDLPHLRHQIQQWKRHLIHSTVDWIRISSQKLWMKLMNLQPTQSNWYHCKC